jgi:hypothetical protein
MSDSVTSPASPFSTVLLAKVGIAMVLMWAGRTLETV